MCDPLEAVGDIVGGATDAIGSVVDEVVQPIAHAVDVASDHIEEIAIIAAVVYTGGAAAGAWGAPATSVAAAATGEVATISAATASASAATASGLAGVWGMTPGIAATAVNGAALNAGIGIIRTGSLDGALENAARGALTAGAGAWASQGINSALATSVADGSISKGAAQLLSGIGGQTAVGTVANGGDVSKALEAAVKQQAGQWLAKNVTGYVSDSIKPLVADGTISKNVGGALVNAAGGGITAGLSGKSVAEGALAAGLGSYAGSTIKDQLGQWGATPNVTNALATAGSAGTSAAVLGGDPLKSAVVAGLTSYADSTIKDLTSNKFLQSLGNAVVKDQIGVLTQNGTTRKVPANSTRVISPDGTVRIIDNATGQIIDQYSGAPGGAASTGTAGTPTGGAITGGQADLTAFSKAFQDWMAQQGGSAQGVDPQVALMSYTSLYGGAPRPVNEIDQVDNSNKVPDQTTEYDFQSDLINFLQNVQGGAKTSAAARKDYMKKATSSAPTKTGLNTVVGGAYQGNQAKGFDTFGVDSQASAAQLPGQTQGFYG